MKRRKTKLELASVQIDAPHESHNHNADDESHSVTQTIASWHDTPLDTVMDEELKTKLDSAIQKLPYDYRIVFILRDVEGQSAEETGKILKLSVPAVKSRLRRARVFLREELNEYMTS